MKEFKDKEKLPEGWKRVKLGEVVEEVIGGGTPLRSIRDFWENGNIPWLTNEEVKDDVITYIYDTKEKITYKAYKHSNVRFIPPNSVILTLTASIGKVAINKVPLTTNQQFNSFVPKISLLNYKFLAYYLLKSREKIKNLAGLTTFDFVSKAKILEFSLTLPPLPEQQKIAEILETVDNAIEKTDKIIEKYKRIKQGLMQELLTKGIDEKGNIRSEKTHKFKDSPVGRIPVEWEVVKLGSISKLITKGTTPTTFGFKFITEGINFIKVESIDEDGEIIKNQIAFIDEKTHNYLRRSQLKEGDLLFSIAGVIGKVFIVNKEILPANINQALALIRLQGDNVNRKFLFYSLKSRYIQETIKKIAVQLAQTNVSLGDICFLSLPLPPLPEQQRIAEILSQIDKAIEKEQNYKEKLQRLKQGLMEDLLTGKVRVNNLIEEDKNAV